MGSEDRARAQYLVGLDFSPASRRALQVARALAKRTGAKVRVVHVVSPVYQVEGIDAAEYVKERRRWAQQQLRRLHLDSADVVLRVGDPAEQLRDEARRAQVRLLVLGTSHRSLLQRWLVGSVASKLLLDSPVPVLVVPMRPSRGRSQA